MHYLGKPGPHHSKERRGGGSLSPLTLYFLLFLPPHPPQQPPHPPSPLPAQRDGLPLCPVSTEPPFPNKRIINGASLALVYLVPSHRPPPHLFFFFFFFSLTDGHREKGLWVIHTAPGSNKTISSPPVQTPYFSYLGNFHTPVSFPKEARICIGCTTDHQSPDQRENVTNIDQSLLRTTILG